MEKLAARACVPPARSVRSGQCVTLRASHVVSHDNSTEIAALFQAMSGSPRRRARPPSPALPVLVPDRRIQDESEAARARFSAMRAMARSAGVDYFPPGRGVSHAVALEEGYVQPGAAVAAADARATMYGGVGCLGVPVDASDAAAAWAASGGVRWRVPGVLRVELDGYLRPGATAADLALLLADHLAGAAENRAVEFAGPGVKSLPVEARLHVAAAASEWGAAAAVFPPDALARKWLRERATVLAARGPAGTASDPLPRRGEELPAGYENPRLPASGGGGGRTTEADEGAAYDGVLRVDLAAAAPRVAGPGPREWRPVDALAGGGAAVPVHRAYILSCGGGRAADFAEAAAVLRNRTVAPGVQLYVAPASSLTQIECEARGHWNEILVAGARPLPAGCGPCAGLSAGALREGETAVTTTGRALAASHGEDAAGTGSVYLASPAVVAASAVAGHLCSVESVTGGGPAGGGRGGGIHQPQDGGVAAADTPAWEGGAAPARAALHDDEPDDGGEPDGLPERVGASPFVFCDADDLHADLVLPQSVLYAGADDEAAAAERAGAAMRLCGDRRFGELVRDGDVLVAGFRFGYGSTHGDFCAAALADRGVAAVVAASLPASFQRGAANAGVLAVECPALVKRLREGSGGVASGRTERSSGRTLELDLRRWVAVLDGGAAEFQLGRPPRHERELVAAGGAVGLARK